MDTEIRGIRGDITEKIIKSLGLQTAVDVIPNKLSNTIVPVLNVESDKEIQIVETTLSDATSSVFKVTSSTKRTFVIGATMSITKNVANSSIASYIAVNLKSGISQDLILLRYQPTIAESHHAQMNFTKPIELLKGSNITLVNTNGTSSINTFASVLFYEEDEQ